MNHNIEKHDMNIILDALENLRDDMKHAKDNGHFNYAYTISEVIDLHNKLGNEAGLI